MASFECPVVKLRIVLHPNADRLQIAIVGGYQSIVGKGEFKTGDKGIYIPEQAVLPDSLIKKLGLEGKLAGSKKNRVKAIKLRGILSQGLIAPMSFVSKRQDYPLGHDCREELGITKYEPIIPASMTGDVWAAGKDRTLPYDVENIKKFPDTFQENEQVVIAEKIHGTFSMISVMPPNLYDEKNAPDGIVVASKGRAEAGLGIKFPIPAPPLTFQQKIKRAWLKFLKKVEIAFLMSLSLSKEEYEIKRSNIIEDYNQRIKQIRNKGRNEKNLYWRAAKYFNVGQKVKDAFGPQLSKGNPVFVLGEVYGSGVQHLDYGANSGADKTLGMRVFDIYVGLPGQGKFLDDQELTNACITMGLMRVPILYRGPFSMEVVKKYTEGIEMVSGYKKHLREGVVIRPILERRFLELGRVQLKSVSEKYLLTKGKTTDYN